ncbi:MAG TPA: hypothetical protein VKU90_01710 [Caulobacteraceae bacterium]|nr:hypothetical protein [Caulobacteraceae bacterium]
MPEIKYLNFGEVHSEDLDWLLVSRDPEGRFIIRGAVERESVDLSYLPFAPYDLSLALFVATEFADRKGVETVYVRDAENA